MLLFFSPASLHASYSQAGQLYSISGVTSAQTSNSCVCPPPSGLCSRQASYRDQGGFRMARRDPQFSRPRAWWASKPVAICNNRSIRERTKKDH
jgi:hypothetical protein